MIFYHTLFFYWYHLKNIPKCIIYAYIYDIFNTKQYMSLSLPKPQRFIFTKQSYSTDTFLLLSFWNVSNNTLIWITFFLDHELYWNIWRHLSFIHRLPRWRQCQRTCQPMPETQEMQAGSLSWEDPLEKEMATHSSVLAWRIPGTGEPGGLPSGVAQSRTWLKWLSSSSNHSQSHLSPHTHIFSWLADLRTQYLDYGYDLDYVYFINWFSSFN